jgi:uncharacterized membrane protein YbaN (DUF454 family)
MLKRAANKSRFVRSILISFGWVGVLLGVIGLFVPVMPSTVFFIFALWAFSNGSERFHYWLYHHKQFGPPLRAWHEHRAIPVKAKLFAVLGMAFSLVITIFATAEGSLVPPIYALVMVIASTYILSRPSGGANVGRDVWMEGVPVPAR